MESLKATTKRRKLKREVCATKAMGGKGENAFAGNRENTKGSMEVKKERQAPTNKASAKVSPPFERKACRHSIARIAGGSRVTCKSSERRRAASNEKHPR